MAFSIFLVKNAREFGNYIVRECYGSRHEPEYNILNGVVIKEGYIRVTMRV